MSSGDYLAGLAFFVSTLGPVVAATTLVIRKRYAYTRGLPRLFAAATLLTAGMVFAYVGPAAAGILSRGTPIAAAFLLLGAAYLLRSSPDAERARAAAQPEAAPPPSSRASVLIAAVALGTVILYELARLSTLIAQPITNIDMLSFHLPGVATFVQSGTIWQVSQFLPGFATAQYPNNGDFLILGLVSPWHDFAFARLPGVLFFALTGATTYSLAIELRASRAAAATFASVAVILPTFSIEALDGSLDPITVSLLVIGLVFLLRHARTGLSGELVLAGLAIGLSLGTKWFGLTGALVLIPIWAVTRLALRVPRGRVGRDLGVVVGMMVVGGGIWLLRNLIESGNPLYPKSVSPLGLQLFGGSHGDVIDLYGYTILHYLGHPTILREFIYPGFKTLLGLAGLVLLIGVGVAATSAALRLRRRAWLEHENASSVWVVALAVGVVGLCLIYAGTPGSAYGPRNLPLEGQVNIRWLVPALAISAALSARAADSGGRWGVLLEVAGLLAVFDAIKLGTGVSVTEVLVGIAIAVSAAALWLVCRWVASAPRSLMPALAIAGVLAVSAAGLADHRAFNRRFYEPYDPVLRWVGRHASSGHRIGVTGGVGKDARAELLPAFGPRIGNHVSYVGDATRHSLHVPGRLSSFASELKGGHYDLLMIQLQYAGNTDMWARQLGYHLLAHSAALSLYSAPAEMRR